MSYIELPITVDYNDILTELVDTMIALVTGWTPREGHLEMFILESDARLHSETASVAAQVPGAIFRYLGQTGFNIQPIDEVRASVPSTWTLLDNLGHTITAGTQVYFQVDGDTSVAFEVQEDVLVEPGTDETSTGEVTLVAVNAGSAANGIAAGTAFPVDAISWIDTITTASTTSGGVDAETTDDYMNRLVGELRLQAPRPIKPEDFAVFAQRIAGVGRATAIDGYDIGLNEKQRIVISGSPTGGSFTLTFSGQTTSSIAYNATSGTIQTALEALSNIGVGDVVVTGGPLPGTAVVVEFTGALGVTNVAQMTWTDSLTGGTSPATEVTTTQAGVAPSSDNERMVTVAVAAEDGTAVDEDIKDAVKAYLESEREINFVVHVIDPSYTEVNVTATVKALSGTNLATVEALCESALETYLSPANWDFRPTVRVTELISLLDHVPGVDYVDTVTTPSANLVLDGVAPLPTSGAISVTVVP